jgi:threonylcarbamoyladenosine tRNA methylthiotransferase MtaB
MPNRTYHLETLGCRANQADSAALCRQLESREYACAPAADADLLVVNTCTVTRHADQDSRQAIRKLRRENPDARLIVTGCYAQRAPDDLSKIEGVNWVVGNTDQHRLVDLAAAAGCEAGACQIVPTDLSQVRESLPEIPAAAAERRTRPFVKIQDGCDARCSYCIVPHVRGAARSAEPRQVLEQVRRLVGEGYQEIVLTGIHLGVYGRKLETPTSLADLVQEVLRVPGLGRLRLSCVEPMRFSRALVNLAVGQEKLAPHFHIPLQSGCARILALMRRPYRPTQYMNLVDELRKRLPTAAIGTDVIAGFPGETEAEHRESLRFVEESPISHLHVFSYSRREGTPAAGLKELPQEIVRRRSLEWRHLAARKRADFTQAFLGGRFRSLTLQPERNKHLSSVLTGNYLTIHLPGVLLEANQWVEVALDRWVGGTAQGSLA